MQKQNESSTDSELRNEYDALLGLYSRFKGELEYILQAALRSANIPVHTFTSRIKTFESFLQKARLKEDTIENPFDDIRDICGLRIVTLFLSDMDKIDALIRNCLHTTESDNKAADLPAEVFGYMDRQYVVALPVHFQGARYDDLKPLYGEIQVRTIGMDAWASISHYLDYKSPQGVPSSLRKDFYALSGLFYIADQHFEMFFRAREGVRAKAEEDASGTGAILSQEINLETLTAFLHARYPKRERSDSDSVSNLLEAITTAGYSTFDALAQDLDRSEEAFAAFEKKHWQVGIRLYDVGVVRVSLTLANARFLQARMDMEKNFTETEYTEFRGLLK